MSSRNYLGSSKCCNVRDQGPTGTQGPTGPGAIGPAGVTGERGMTGPTGRNCAGPTGPSKSFIIDHPTDAGKYLVQSHVFGRHAFQVERRHRHWR